MNMKNRKGFTLMELLATIVLIAIVASISIFTVLSVVKESKERTYSITIKEIESNATSYLKENSNWLSFLTSGDGKTEYQCITVQNLIDYGYLKNNVVKSLVAKDTNVKKSDYIYVERNASTKTITKSIYVGEINLEFISFCR